MNPNSVTFDVTYTERRSRLTSAFRYILAIPHLIFAGLWGYAANILAFLQWFVILFTGRRNEGMWGFQRAYLGYNARVSSYASLLYDEYPNFGSEWGNEPLAFGLDYRPDANRLTNGLRLIWMIPAMFILFFLGIASSFVLLAVVGGDHHHGQTPTRHVGLHDARLPIQRQPVGLRPADDGRLPALRGLGADKHTPARGSRDAIRNRPAAAPARRSRRRPARRRVTDDVTSSSGRAVRGGRRRDRHIRRDERRRRDQRPAGTFDDL